MINALAFTYFRWETFHVDEKSPSGQLELGLAALRRMAVKSTGRRLFAHMAL